MTKISDSCVDLAKSYGEMGIDTFLENGLLKDIPIVGSVISVANGVIGIKDHLFLKKLEAFLFDFNKQPEEERIKMRERLKKDGYQKEIGQKVVFILENADSLNKASLIGKCFLAYLEERISKDELFRIWHSISRVFIEDLKLLFEYEDATANNQDVGFSLSNAGLVYSTGIAGGGFMDKTSYEGGTIFQLSHIGQLLLKIL